MNEKRCHGCGKMLSTLDFHAHFSSPDKLQNRCKTCQRKRVADINSRRFCPRCRTFKKIWSEEKDICFTCQTIIETKIIYGEI